MTAAVPPWFARSLAEAALRSASTPLRCDVRSRRGLCRGGSRPRDSKTMFGKRFRTPSQLPGLSVTVLPAYSSLHCLCGMNLSRYLYCSLHVIAFSVNR